MSAFGGFFDKLTGKSQQKDIDNAYNQSKGYLQSGYDEATGAAKGYYDKAQSYYDPYAASGRRAQSAYDDSIGLNGAEGGKNALTMYQNARNPYLDWEQNRAQTEIDRAANARGGLNTGYNALAVARARQGMGYQDYNNWQSRLQGQAGMGAQIAGQQAQMANQFGQWQGDARLGLGQQQAGNAINYGNASAANKTNSVNAIMKGAGGLGQFIMQGTVPGAGGSSAFGNMGNALSNWWSGGGTGETGGYLPVTGAGQW
jgi:hypothetical protein